MSISIVKNYPLDKLNTFNISANAKFFYEFKTLESLKEILNHKLLKTEKSFVLGGGSNILISNDFDGVVLKANADDLSRVTSLSLSRFPRDVMHTFFFN